MNKIKKARIFLENQFKSALDDKKHVEQIVLITKDIFKDLFKKFINDYIIKNPDGFFDIDWSYSPIRIHEKNITIYDVLSKNWEEILTYIKDNKSLNTIKRKNKINKDIDDFKKQANEEKESNNYFI